MKDAVSTEHDVAIGSFALRIRDDMMSPSFGIGDLVLIDPKQPPRPGDFVAALDGNGKVVFSRYRIAGSKPDGSPVIELIPENPYYPSWRSDEHKIEVIGVMIEHRIPRRRIHS